jgi:hypothetical protein
MVGLEPLGGRIKVHVGTQGAYIKMDRKMDGWMGGWMDR